MCTAITYKTKDAYFGRTLDYEISFGEEIVITPREFKFEFGSMETVKSHYAMIGIAHVSNNYPLYYDAINEKGLGMAGLNFVGNAVYNEKADEKDNVAPYEFIPWILGQCASVDEAKNLLNRINLEKRPFNDELPFAKLHWIIADRNSAITVEAVAEGIKIYDNQVGVLTNNPPFDMQMFQLNNYMQLSAKEPQNKFSDKLELNKYSRGMGAMGLPGDLSSQSRFVRAAFVKLNSVSEALEKESVNQFFHILGAVTQVRGCCEVEDGKYEITIYSSCYNLDKGIFYYTTYDNHQVSAVNMFKENLDDCCLVKYPLVSGERIFYQN